MTEETPITFAENDARLIKYVSYEYDYTPASPCYTEGALVTFDVPAKTSATFKLANDSSYKIILYIQIWRMKKAGKRLVQQVMLFIMIQIPLRNIMY